MSDPLDRKKRLLEQQLAYARKAAETLEYSWNKITPDKIDEHDQETQETLEAMTARFARLEDILVKKVFRAVAAYELSDCERLIDVLNLMEKLGLIDEVEQWIEFKDLRNLIVHEYELDNLAAIHRKVYRSTPALVDSVGRVVAYVSGD